MCQVLEQYGHRSVVNLNKRSPSPDTSQDCPSNNTHFALKTLLNLPVALRNVISKIKFQQQTGQKGWAGLFILQHSLKTSAEFKNIY